MENKFHRQKLKEKIDKARVLTGKEHFKTFSNYEINVPVAYETTLKKHEIISYGIEPFSYVLTKHINFNEIKSIYNEMKENFEREITDLITLKSPKIVYFISTYLLNPGMLKSNKYRYVGVISLSDDYSISFIWLHPFLRNKGLMKNFMIWYAQNEYPLLFCPPLTKQMQHMLTSINYLEINEKIINVYRKWLKLMSKSNNENIDLLNDDFIIKMMSSLRSLCLNLGESFDNGKTSQTIKYLCEIFIELQNNPDKLKTFIDFAENDKDNFADFKNKEKLKNDQVMKYGYRNQELISIFDN